MAASPFARGVALAVGAACAFGVTTPLVQRWGAGVGPLATAALLYAGAAIASAVPGKRGGAKPTRKDAPRIVAVAIAGAVIAPALLAWGLQRTSAVTGSLLLNLEAVFTVLLAWAVHREPLGGRVAGALVCIAAGGAVLLLGGSGGAPSGGAVAASALGAVAVAAATLAWAVDNAMTRPLAELDPARVVLAKGALGATLACASALVLGEAVPEAWRAVGLVACGATGYGASLRLYLAAQRTIGAGRTASVFAIAPFVGAVVAVAMGGRAPFGATGVAAALCAVGVALHVTEHHAHPHRHAAVEHEHAHRHDDGHHEHGHAEPVVGEHTHRHRHEDVVHEHDHAPDVHHDHSHS